MTTSATIETGAELRDHYWFLQGRDFEQQFRDPNVARIDLNLSTLAWADPVPLLSIACLCGEFRDRGGRLQIELGDRRRQSLQFLIFFAQHGFLQAIAHNAKVRWEGTSYEPARHDLLETILRSLPAALAYQDAECIPARLFSLDGQRAGLETLVEDLVALAHPRISSWLPGNSRRRGLMSHQLRVFLHEALDNVGEHAYRGRRGYGAIYARIRAGVPEERQAFEMWRSARQRETRQCPTLMHCRTGRKPGWLELFVVDTGIGITGGLPGKSPLQTLSGKLFRTPYSRVRDRSAAGKTNMTGLQRIGHLLLAGHRHNNRGDFVRIYANGEWTGEHLPWPDNGPQVGHLNARQRTDARYPLGTVFHFALEPPPASAREQAAIYPSGFFQPKSGDLGRVRQQLALEKTDALKAGFAFHDVYRGEDQADVLANADLMTPDAMRSRTMVVRPPRVQRKIDLILQLNHALSGDSRVRSLIFVDVPWSSAIDYYNIIVLQRTWQLAVNDGLTVHILSQDWFCASLRFNRVTSAFEVSEELARNFVEAPRTTASAAFAAGVLRRQDSLLFWDAARSSYINEPIRWRSGEEEQSREIWGYLDLGFALANSKVFEIARRAVRRTVSSFAVTAVHPVDEMAERVLGTDFEMMLPSSFDGDGQVAPASGGPDADQSAIFVGSVLGSGGTFNRHLRGIAVQPEGIMQMLSHPDFTRSRDPAQLLALDWLPPVRGGRPRTLFERVGSSPLIIRGGEAAVPLARFATPRGGVRGASLYGEEPNKAYQRWQRLGLLRLGHWTYGANHDLLTLRLNDALEFDSVEGGEIVTWLAEQISQWIPSPNGERAGFVLYAQHSVTAELVRSLAAHPLCQRIQFFPVASEASQQKAALIISPMAREAIVNACRGALAGGGAAVILDDAIISGATMRHIRHALEGIWAAMRDNRGVDESAVLTIHSLALVERSGEPAQRSLVEHRLNIDRRYWRWDVPSLGHGGTCGLCGLLGRWKALRSGVHGRLLQQRLEQWLTLWSPTPVLEGRFDAGVPQRRLTGVHSTRFGVDRGVDDHRVHHSTSVSRVSIAAEIAHATTRKDYPLRKARSALDQSSDIDAQTGLEILATQLLLCQDDLVPVDRIDRLHLLLDLIWRSDEATISSALAGLVTLVNPELIDNLWDHVIQLIDAEGFPHEDAILVALGLFHMTGRTEPPALKQGSAWEVFDLCRQSSSELRQALAMILRAFGFSINSVHRSTLLVTLGRELSDIELSQAILMLERLSDAFKGMPLVAIEGSMLKPREDGAALADLVSRLARTRALPDADVTSTTDPTDVSARLSAQLALQHAARSMLFGPDGLHERYIIELCVTLTEDNGFRDLIAPAWRIMLERWPNFLKEKGAEMIAKWPKEPFLWFDDPEEACQPIKLYYDSTIRLAVAECMSNVAHRDRAIPCPWPDGSLVPQADLWAKLDYGTPDGGVAIILANGYAGDGEIRTQTRPSVMHLKSLGGDVETIVDEVRLIIFTRILLPTSAGITRYDK